MTIAYTSAKRAVYQFDLAVFKILTDWDISLDPFGNKHFSTAWTTLDFLMDFRLNKSGLFDFYDAVIYSLRIVASLCIPIIFLHFRYQQLTILIFLNQRLFKNVVQWFSVNKKFLLKNPNNSNRFAFLHIGCR